MKTQRPQILELDSVARGVLRVLLKPTLLTSMLMMHILELMLKTEEQLISA